MDSRFDLTQHDLQRFCSGTNHLEKTSEGLLLHRFTPKQLAYADSIKRFIPRLRAPAGITIAFETDATHLRFRLHAEAADNTRHLGFAWEVDGVVRQKYYQVPVGDTIELKLDERWEPQARKRSFRLVLPTMRMCRLLEFSLNHGAQVVPIAPPDKKYLAIGDSITQGTISPTGFSSYAYQLSRSLGMELINQGLGGHFFDADIIDRAICPHPDLITVAYGTNDWGRFESHDQITEKVGQFLERMIDAWPDAREKTAVVTPLWRENGQVERRGIDFYSHCETIASTVRSHNFLCIDGLQLVPHDKALFPDGLHPEGEGYYYYTCGLRSALEKMGLV